MVYDFKPPKNRASEIHMQTWNEMIFYQHKQLGITTVDIAS